MKIIHIIPYFQPELGYQEYYLAKQHLEMGNEVAIITSEYIAPYPEIINIYKELGIANGRKIKRHDNIPPNLKIIKLPKIIEYDDFILVRELKKHIIDQNPDAVFAHEARQGIAIEAAWVCKKVNIPFFLDQHDYGFWLGYAKHRRIIEYKFFRKFLIDYAFSVARNVFGINYGVETFLEKMGHKGYKNKFVQIGQCVSTDDFYFDIQAAQNIREQYNIPKDVKIISFFGKLAHYKKIEILFDALKNIKEEVIVFIVGGGDDEYLDYLKEYSNTLLHKIIFVGHIIKESLRGYYSVTDICVFPNTNSVTILEAMACGCAIILSEREDCKPYINRNGYIFKINDSNDLEMKIQKILIDNSLLEEMKNKSIELVKNKYNYSKSAEKIVDFIRNAL